MSWKTALPDRFWQKVAVYPGGCWWWHGPTFSNGYGCFWWRGRNYAAHRVVAAVALGFDLSSDLQVCHKCDRKDCVNPKHLFIGTQSDNMRDCVAKGRHVRNNGVGSDHYLAVLTEDVVREARKRRTNGERLCDLAAEYKVHRETLGSAIRGHSWKHVHALEGKDE